MAAADNVQERILGRLEELAIFKPLAIGNGGQAVKGGGGGVCVRE